MLPYTYEKIGQDVTVLLQYYTNATKMYIVVVYLCIANDKNLEGFEVYIGLTKQKAEINYSHKEQKSDRGQSNFGPKTKS